MLTDTVTIVGAGALGQAYAAHLARAGRPVALLTRKASFERLAAAGCVRLRGLAQMDIPVRVLNGQNPAPRGSIGLTSDPALLPPGSGLIFATKAHQLSAAVDAVRTAEKAWSVPAAWVLGVQNGMQKDEVLGDAFGTSRLIGAATILGAQHAADGSVLMTGPGPTYLGEFAPEAAECAANAAAILSDGGLLVEPEADIRVVLWSKACNAAGVFGVCVLARCSGPRMSGTPALVRAFLSLVRETADLALAYGVRVGDYPGFPIRTYVDRDDDATIAILGQHVRELLASGAPESFPSMVQDVLHGRPLEVEGVFGDLVERAAQRSQAIPRVAFVCDVLRGINTMLSA